MRTVLPTLSHQTGSGSHCPQRNCPSTVISMADRRSDAPLVRPLARPSRRLSQSADKNKPEAEERPEPVTSVPQPTKADDDEVLSDFWDSALNPLSCAFWRCGHVELVNAGYPHTSPPTEWRRLLCQSMLRTSRSPSQISPRHGYVGRELVIYGLCSFIRGDGGKRKRFDLWQVVCMMAVTV